MTKTEAQQILQNSEAMSWIVDLWNPNNLSGKVIRQHMKRAFTSGRISENELTATGTLEDHELGGMSYWWRAQNRSNRT